MQDKYGKSIQIENTTMDQAVPVVTAALAAEGFGVLTRIDVNEVLKKKIDVDFRPYTILGACNPTLAHTALSQDADIGLLLPCNVVVEQSGSGVRVNAIDPIKMFAMTGAAEVHPVAQDAADRLDRVLTALTSS